MTTVDSVNVVHDKLAPDCLHQMKRLEMVQQTNDKRLNNDFHDKVRIEDKYE